ncbi:MAG: type VI secretion system-associated protein TagF, partial [Acetobacteraceae bacterium]
MTTTPVFGLFGKLPARGDFIRIGLPRDFTDPWDEWLRLVLSASR